MGFNKLYLIKIIFILILISLKLNGIHSAGKIFTTAANKRYFINEDQKYSWFDALSECLQMNMTLVTIDTSKKSEEINTLVKTTYGRIVILWVGGIMTQYPDSRHYIWIGTGQKFTYNYWHNRNPDFNGNNEYCIQIGWGPNMEWNDNRCASNYGFMCEDHQLPVREQKNGSMDITDKQNILQELDKEKLLVQSLQKQLKEIREEKEQLLLKESIPKSLTEERNEKENKKYRDVIFQFNQNTYFMPNAQVTLDRNYS